VKKSRRTILPLKSDKENRVLFKSVNVKSGATGCPNDGIIHKATGRTIANSTIVSNGRDTSFTERAIFP